MDAQTAAQIGTAILKNHLGAHEAVRAYTTQIINDPEFSDWADFSFINLAYEGALEPHFGLDEGIFLLATAVVRARQEVTDPIDLDELEAWSNIQTDASYRPTPRVPGLYDELIAQAIERIINGGLHAQEEQFWAEVERGS